MVMLKVHSALRCAYCHDDLQLGAWTGCARCGTCLHGGCWQEAGLCPTLGCAPPPVRPRLTISLPPPPNHPAASHPPAVGDVHTGSVLSGAFGALLWTACAHAVPAFTRMFNEVGLALPRSSEFVIGVPGWVWWGLGMLSLLVLALKDRWVRSGLLRERLNCAYALFVLGAGAWIVWSLFLPLTCSRDRL